MIADHTLLLILIACAMALFVWGRWRYDLVALFTLLMGVLLNLIPANEAFTGFSNPAVVMVVAIMILSHSISRSGVIDGVILKLAPFASTKSLLIGTLCIMVATFSAFMNNTGALALMIPIVLQLCDQHNHQPSHILMPVAFASALGGMTTLIGTPPNLIISQIRAEHGSTAFQLFDFTPVGLLVASISIVFISLLGWRLLPSRNASHQTGTDHFSIEQYLIEVGVPKKSEAVGQTIAALKAHSKTNLTIVGMSRHGKKTAKPSSTTTLQEGDILMVKANHDDLSKVCDRGLLSLIHHPKTRQTSHDDELKLSEAIVAPGSRLMGRSFKQSHNKHPYEVSLIALSRQGEEINSRLQDTPLKEGDVLLLQGKPETLQLAFNRLGLLPLQERELVAPNQYHTYLPLLTFIMAILAIALLRTPAQIAFLAAIVLLIICKVLPLNWITRSVDWPVIILLGAMIPVGRALESTGCTVLIAQSMVDLASTHTAPLWFLGLIMLVTIIISAILNNVATTVIMAPIAVAIAQTLHVSMDPFLMAVCLGASCSFLTPIGHQNNVIVMGPGRYHFTDYLRLGLPLGIIILIVGVPAITWVWPF